ncbi:MAG: hypothetical protein K6D02_03320 [Lachnospiraceae bacterium]|nr:hypothetical protein [Lachnospiraceae bacterium]
MYKYVDDSKIKKDKKMCRNILDELRKNLKEKGISSVIMLVGSGEKSVVTQNENEPYDLDYNLVIHKISTNSDEHLELNKNLKGLKYLIIQELNKLVKDTDFSEGRDKRSCITSVMRFANGSGRKFSFDLAVVKYNKKMQLCRLIHRKEDDTYVWNEVPHTYNLKKLTKEIHEKGGSHQLKEEYLKLKNMYLQRGDREHSSFVIYAEAVNHIYQKYHK